MYMGTTYNKFSCAKWILTVHVLSVCACMSVHMLFNVTQLQTENIHLYIFSILYIYKVGTKLSSLSVTSSPASCSAASYYGVLARWTLCTPLFSCDEVFASVSNPFDE